MTEREDNVASSTPPADLDWEQEKTKARVRQFMNILEQLPRLCSPTICGTLSQPTTRAERVSRGTDRFEWSLEQKAILSPANITTDTDAADEWQQNVADLNPSWRQQESETFFSQRTIAPSPLINTPLARGTGALGRQVPSNFQDLMCDEEDEEDEGGEGRDEQRAQDLTTNHSKYSIVTKDQSSLKLMSYEFDQTTHCSDTDFELGEDEPMNEEENEDDDETNQTSEQADQDMDNLLFSPQPLRSSQSQQRMDIFSPETFVRVMEDENTLQSTPKTTGSLLRAKTRSRTDVLD